MRLKTKLFFIIILLLSLCLVACNTISEQSEVATAEMDEEEPAVENSQYNIVEIENNGRTLTFTEAPQRAVTLNQHVTELMLALGLEDNMVGTAYIDDEILPEYQKTYESIPVLAEQYPSQEVLLEVQPDFVYAGWESGFRDDAVGTAEQLLERGINPYLHISSSKVGPLMEDIYTDIRNISKIFNVEERGESLIQSMEEEIEQISTRIPVNADKKSVFVYDSGETAPFTVGKNFLNSIITMAGGSNIFGDVDKNWAEVSWEEIVDRNPEVVVIIDYGETSADEKIEFLLNHPALADVEAIENEHFVVVPLSAAAEGIRVPIALEILVNGLHEK